MNRVMRFRIIHILIAAICLSPAPIYGQQTLTATQWQEDLIYLKHKVQSEYPFLFKKVTVKEFGEEVETLHRSIPDLADHEIIAGFARIISLFKYGHTRMGLQGGPVTFRTLPINIYQFKDGFYVEGTHRDYKQALGARIVQIEGMPVAEALQKIRPVIPAENDQFVKAYGLSYLRVPEILHAQGVTKELKSEIRMTLDKDGQSIDVTFTAGTERAPTQYGFVEEEDPWLSMRNQEATPRYLKHLDKIYYHEYLPEHKALYVRHSQIQDDPAKDIPAFYEEVFAFVEDNDVERLILDVRLNGGGNNYKNKPIVTGVIKSDKINQPGQFIVIIGRRTFSACQNLVNELDNYTQAIFIGEPTSENVNFYGDNRRVELPNSKMSAYLSFAWWQDKPPWENAPHLAPHVAVEMSAAEYAANADPVLDLALTYSSKDFVSDPMAHLTKLFEQGKIAEVESAARRFVADPRYQFVDFEDNFNRAGYNLMQGDRLEEALFVFRLNNELFPESANTWDSLGEALHKADRRDESISHYKKAIELDPDGPVGENARKMLAEIDTQD